jgi:hypothetical protein
MNIHDQDIGARIRLARLSQAASRFWPTISPLTIVPNVIVLSRVCISRRALT